ncbi:MAG: hypothetical protein OES25_13935 [Acidobacteriota bacterium]|nr:hypothetical protein [Acidobacteriota bacterium]
MSTAATFAAIVAGKQAQYLRRFQEAGATEQARAVALEEIHCDRSAVFQALVDSGVMIEVTSGKYYLDLKAAESSEARRRMVTLGIIIVAIIIVLVTLWVR